MGVGHARFHGGPNTCLMTGLTGLTGLIRVGLGRKLAMDDPGIAFYSHLIRVGLSLQLIGAGVCLQPGRRATLTGHSNRSRVVLRGVAVA